MFIKCVFIQHNRVSFATLNRIIVKKNDWMHMTFWKFLHLVAVKVKGAESRGWLTTLQQCKSKIAAQQLEGCSLFIKHSITSSFIEYFGLKAMQMEQRNIQKQMSLGRNVSLVKIKV